MTPAIALTWELVARHRWTTGIAAVFLLAAPWLPLIAAAYAMGAGTMLLLSLAGHGFERPLGVLRLPVPFNARVFGEARLELHRGSETLIERWPAVNHYELQAAAFHRTLREGVAYPCPLEFSRGTQAMP